LVFLMLVRSRKARARRSRALSVLSSIIGVFFEAHVPEKYKNFIVLRYAFDAKRKRFNRLSAAAGFKRILTRKAHLCGGLFCVRKPKKS
ncbi:MAG: hypothetical protein J6R45_00465, partial [Clostridia bacterium]|nr:hypothetical protein [Clostridia bacterium]